MVLESGGLVQERLPPGGIPLPSHLMHLHLREFLHDFTMRFSKHVAELGYEFSREGGAVRAALSLADLVATGIFVNDEDDVKGCFLMMSERCCLSPEFQHAAPSNRAICG
jgi:hypothetical protein